jgi:hypothetical protein
MPATPFTIWQAIQQAKAKNDSVIPGRAASANPESRREH